MLINLSNLTLGNVALTQMYEKAKKLAFKAKITPVPPPKNKIAVKVDKNKIDAYSDKKNKTKIDDEYSVMWPDTNSDSASTLSNGGLAHSATHPINQIIDNGNNGTPNQIVCCNSTYLDKFIVPANKIQINTTVVNTNS